MLKTKVCSKCEYLIFNFLISYFCFRHTFFMLTNILEQSTRLICVGSGAMALVMKSFRIEEGVYEINDSGVIELASVVSRKKQLVPSLVIGIRM